MQNEADLYDRLVDMYNTIGFGAMPTNHLKQLLKVLFNEDEARTVLAMTPGVFHNPLEIAQQLAEEPARVAQRLEAMTNKGLLYCRPDHPQQYRILQLLPGVFELQFMRGQRSSADVELARLFEEVLHSSPAAQRPPDITPFARIIPVQTSIEATTEVFTYEQVSRYIDTAQDICLTTCYCRHQKGLLGKSCSAPKDVCLQFGPFARFIIDRKFGRRITREEAQHTIERALEHGLVLTSTNTQKHIDFICACCGCCCGILKSIKSAHMPSMAAKSNFYVSASPDICTGCGTCLETCHMEALSLVEDIVRVDTDRCIGCGICSTKCPSGALVMVRRSNTNEPPATYKELQARIVQDMVASTGVTSTTQR